jgi:hypothetical protein
MKSGYASWTRLHFGSDTLLEGAGTVSLQGNRSAVEGEPGVALTVAANQTVEGIGLSPNPGGHVTLPTANHGTIEARGGLLTFDQPLTNDGTLRSETGGTLCTQARLTQKGLFRAEGGVFDVNGPLFLENPGQLATSETSPIHLSGALLGGATSPPPSRMGGTLVLDGGEEPPIDLEVMGEDLGSTQDGFRKARGLDSLTLAEGARVRLVDFSDNASGEAPEALYVHSLIVPAGATLDINGLTLYTQATQIAGTVLGGSVEQIPDSGSLVLGQSVPGNIATPGELDEWTFLAQAGQQIAIVVNPGASGTGAAPPPHLGWARFSLLDPDGNPIAEADSTEDGLPLVATDAAIPASGIYRIHVRAAPGHQAASGGYSLSVWDNTPEIRPLVPGETNAGRLNSPYAANHWTFSASAGEQIRLSRSSGSGSGIVFDLLGPNGWQGFSGLSDSSDPVNLPDDGEYTVIARNDSGRFGDSYGFRIEQTSASDLALGETASESLAGSRYAHIFRIRTTLANPMLVTLDPGSAPGATSASGDSPELFLKYGSPPTRTDFGYHSASGERQILVPRAAPGTWYVLVYAHYVPEPRTYQILALGAPVLLVSVSPGTQDAGAEAEFTIAGAGFSSSMNVELIGADDQRHPAGQVEVESPTRLKATFPADSLAAGVYSVAASRPDAPEATLPGAVEILTDGEPEFVASLVIPERVGYHQPATIFIDYANEGTLPMRAPLVELEPVQNNRPGALITLDKNLLSGGLWTNAVPEGFSHRVQMLAGGAKPGWLMPGERARVPVYWAGWQQPWDFSYPKIIFNLNVVKPGNTEPIDWSAFKDALQPKSVPDDAWDVVYQNFVGSAGGTWGGYLAMLDESAEYLSKFGEKTMDIGQLLGFQIARANNALLPMTELARSTDVSLDAPGLGLVFRRFWQPRISDRFRTGPLGVGWRHNWQISREMLGDGTAVLHWSNNGLRVFQPDIRGGWIAQPGERATLSGPPGALTLTEISGIRYSFDSNGNLSSVEGRNGNKISCHRTGGRLVRLVHSAGPELQISYDSDDRIETLTDSLGRTTRFAYAADAPLLLSATAPDGRAISYQYETSAQSAARYALTQITHRDGVVQHFEWSPAGFLSKVFYGDGMTPLEFRYERGGTLVVSNALGFESQYEFDQYARPRLFRDELGNPRSFSFDSLHRHRRFTTPTGSSFAMD